MSGRPKWAVARGPSNLLPYMAFAGTDHGGLLPLRERERERDLLLARLCCGRRDQGLLTGRSIDCAEQDRVESEGSSSANKSRKYEAGVPLTLHERHVIQWSLSS